MSHDSTESSASVVSILHLAVTHSDFPIPVFAHHPASRVCNFPSLDTRVRRDHHRHHTLGYLGAADAPTQSPKDPRRFEGVVQK